MKLRIIAIIFTCFLLGGCTKESLSRQSTNNPNFNVELLFEYDSIKVYRFGDGGYTHYFTKNMTITTQSCGKNCHKEEIIETR